MIPRPFRERYADLADDSDAFFSCLEQMPPKSFRVNTIKSDVDEVRERFREYGIGIKQMPWCQEAFTSDEHDIGSTLEHFLGKIYAQELVSMLPPLVVKEELGSLVLDACAAPGSKTTQLAALMGNKGTLIANDISYKRIKALRFNLEKSGVLNTLVTNQDLRFFPDLRFDSILLDAPCSSEGTARKNPKLFNVWSEKHVRGHSRLQKQLITRAFDLLKPGGLLVYSTCTFSPEENEEVVTHLLAERDARIEPITIPGMRTSQGIEGWRNKEFDPEVKKAVRIWPHHNDTGGFFIARFRK